MNTNSIYVINAIPDVDFSIPHHVQIREDRCVGWFHSFQEAEVAIQDGIFKDDDDENGHKYFNWFVIEETAPGCLKAAISRTWYHWDIKTQTYKEAPDCKKLDIYPNIGIG